MHPDKHNNLTSVSPIGKAQWQAGCGPCAWIGPIRDDFTEARTDALRHKND